MASFTPHIAAVASNQDRASLKPLRPASINLRPVVGVEASTQLDRAQRMFRAVKQCRNGTLVDKHFNVVNPGEKYGATLYFSKKFGDLKADGKNGVAANLTRAALEAPDAFLRNQSLGDLAIVVENLHHLSHEYAATDPQRGALTDPIIKMSDAALTKLETPAIKNLTASQLKIERKHLLKLIRVINSRNDIPAEILTEHRNKLAEIDLLIAQDLTSNTLTFDLIEKRASLQSRFEELTQERAPQEMLDTLQQQIAVINKELATRRIAGIEQRNGRNAEMNRLFGREILVLCKDDQASANEILKVLFPGKSIEEIMSGLSSGTLSYPSEFRNCFQIGLKTKCNRQMLGAHFPAIESIVSRHSPTLGQQGQATLIRLGIVKPEAPAQPKKADASSQDLIRLIDERSALHYQLSDLRIQRGNLRDVEGHVPQERKPELNKLNAQIRDREDRIKHINSILNTTPPTTTFNDACFQGKPSSVLELELAEFVRLEEHFRSLSNTEPYETIINPYTSSIEIYQKAQIRIKKHIADRKEGEFVEREKRIFHLKQEQKRLKLLKETIREQFEKISGEIRQPEKVVGTGLNIRVIPKPDSLFQKRDDLRRQFDQAANELVQVQTELFDLEPNAVSQTSRDTRSVSQAVPARGMERSATMAPQQRRPEASQTVTRAKRVDVSSPKPAQASDLTEFYGVSDLSRT